MRNTLVSMYENGAITADHLVAQCVEMVNPDDPGLVLGDLPRPILDRLLEYIRRYQPGQMISNYGPVPSIDQVEAARSWIEDLNTVKDGGKPNGEADWYRYKMEERILDILRTFAFSAIPAVPFDNLSNCHRVCEELRIRLQEHGASARWSWRRETCIDHLHGKSDLQEN